MSANNDLTRAKRRRDAHRRLAVLTADPGLLLGDGDDPQSAIDQATADLAPPRRLQIVSRTPQGAAAALAKARADALAAGFTAGPPDAA